MLRQRRLSNRKFKEIDTIVITKDIDCRPCYKRFRVPRCESLDCLTTINSEEVLGAIEGLGLNDIR